MYLFNWDSNSRKLDRLRSSSLGFANFVLIQPGTLNVASATLSSIQRIRQILIHCFKKLPIFYVYSPYLQIYATKNAVYLLMLRSEDSY